VISADGEYRIYGDRKIFGIGSPTANTITVNTGVTADIILENVNIDVSGIENACAFNITGATVALRLSGENTLKSGNGFAGLQAPSGSTLTITSINGNGSTFGTLNTTGGVSGAGIGGAGGGGKQVQNGGIITIFGGTINATGGDGGAGIGGGVDGGGQVTISGGAVNATGGRYAAGIGGGVRGIGGNINITDGFVTATAQAGDGDPAAIGGGGYGDAGTINISSGAVVAISGSNNAAIGGGNGKNGGSIRISGGTIIASGLGIGIGNANGSTPTTISGAPVIFATRISSNPSNPARGIVYGTGLNIDQSNKTITLKTSFTVPENALLTIPADWTINYTGHSLTINGTIISNGTLNPSRPLYTVSFNMNGHGSVIDPVRIVAGSKRHPAIQPADPAAEGCTFGGWYKERECINQWDFNSDVVSSNTILYAKWIVVAIDGADYSINFANILIATNGEYRISGNGEATTNSIKVNSGVTANITIGNVNVDVSRTENACAFDMSGANVTLRLNGVNTLKSGDSRSGILAPSGSTLTITSINGDGSTYGTLNATAGIGGAGIGGGGGEYGGIYGGAVQNGGIITISGGTVNATSGSGGAGIGGGAWGIDGGTVEIKGGLVNATGGATGSATGAGIGGGYRSSSIGAGYSGVVIISDGTVNATGGFGGAGIGSAHFDCGGSITIKGGFVNAIGGERGAGIGGGWEGSGDRISISGGTVIAIGGSGYIDGHSGAGIGSGYEGSSGNIISISDATVIAIGGGDNATGIGSDNKDSRGDSIAIFGAPVIFASSISGGRSSMPEKGFAAGSDVTINPSSKTIILNTDFTVPAGTTLTIPARWTLNHTGYSLTNNGSIIANGSIIPQMNCTISYNMNGHGTAIAQRVVSLGTRLQEIEPADPTAEGYIFGGWYKESKCKNQWNFSSDIVSSDITLYAKWIEPNFNINAGNVTILYDYGEYRIYGNGTPTTNTIRVDSGVNATITLDNVNIDISMTVDACAFDMAGANVTLLLSGVNSLKSGQNKAGLHIPAGSTLTITSIDGDGSTLGTLNATGGEFGAGIGSQWDGNGGTISILGGTVYAYGGRSSAGIGGGINGNGGTIRISGGEVNATGGYQGAGIGGGFDSNGGIINISGGTINASGGEYAAGIGGGRHSNGGVITISGGTGIARGGTGTIGIGDGYQGNNAAVITPDGTISSIPGEGYVPAN
jgi:uncharacterized repeat protein (TIGR02543 family)